MSDLLFRISNDVRGIGKHASMVQTQLEQVAKSQRELLDEMNNNIHDFVVRVATRGGKMTREPLYPEGHPKRIEHDSQRNNTTAPSSSKKKKKKKNDRTLHASGEPEIEKPPDNNNDASISGAETQSGKNIHLVIMKILTMCTLANTFMSLKTTLENKITSMQML